MQTLKILIIVSSHAQMGSTGKLTGFWFEELAVPYYTFVKAGATVDIASPKGGNPPADPRSTNSDNSQVQKFRNDQSAMNKLTKSLRLSDIRERYDAIFIAGGHGVMWDLATDEHLAKLLSKAYEQKSTIGAVCHGPAGLIKATKSNGEPLVKGHRVASFSNEEEEKAELTKVVPFLLQSKLRELGGNYEHGAPFASFAIRDGQLVTGQNPASSADVARLVLEGIQKR